MWGDEVGTFQYLSRFDLFVRLPQAKRADDKALLPVLDLLRVLCCVPHACDLLLMPAGDLPSLGLLTLRVAGKEGGSAKARALVYKMLANWVAKRTRGPRERQVLDCRIIPTQRTQNFSGSRNVVFNIFFPSG